MVADVSSNIGAGKAVLNTCFTVVTFRMLEVIKIQWSVLVEQETC